MTGRDRTRPGSAHPDLFLDAAGSCVWVAGRQELARYGRGLGDVLVVRFADGQAVVEDLTERRPFRENERAPFRDERRDP